MWAVGTVLFMGLPKYYHQAPGKVPSFYMSLLRRKIILVSLPLESTSPHLPPTPSFDRGNILVSSGLMCNYSGSSSSSSSKTTSSPPPTAATGYTSGPRSTCTLTPSPSSSPFSSSLSGRPSSTSSLGCPPPIPGSCLSSPWGLVRRDGRRCCGEQATSGSMCRGPGGRWRVRWRGGACGCGWGCWMRCRVSVRLPSRAG